MTAELRRTDGAQPADRSAPDDLPDNALMERLAIVQARARELMQEFNIASANISVMAWQAEQAIADMAVRSEFLRLLIDLHEFGRLARRRGLLSAPKTKAQAPQPAASIAHDTSLFASDEEAADTVSTDKTRAFFQFLDR